MNELYRKLGYEFKDESLLRRALTHPSYWGGRKGENYQRLEFLGDAVLGYVIMRCGFYKRTLDTLVKHKQPHPDEAFPLDTNEGA